MTCIKKKIIRKLQSQYFKGKLFMHGILGLPAQTGREMQIFKAVFDNFSPNKKIKIFEWGSGFSTIYYASYLRKKSIEFEWYSVDNNKAWHEKVKSKVENIGLQQQVQLYLKEFPSFWEKPGWGPIPPVCGAFAPSTENERDYINLPRELNIKFDIVIVDARFRRHCIQTAKTVLLPEGIVVMHDAEKAHYHVGLEAFQYSRFFHGGSWFPFQEISNKVWIGSVGNSQIFESLKKSNVQFVGEEI